MLFFSLMCFNIYTNEVVTIAEAAETVEMTETSADEAQHEWIPSRRKGRFESGFFQLSSKQIWETMPANIFGDQGNLSLNHFREQLVLLMGNKG